MRKIQSQVTKKKLNSEKPFILSFNSNLKKISKSNLILKI